MKGKKPYKKDEQRNKIYHSEGWSQHIYFVPLVGETTAVTLEEIRNCHYPSNIFHFSAQDIQWLWFFSELRSTNFSQLLAGIKQKIKT